MVYPWLELKHLNPFQIDALGLVTLLGSEEINLSIGRLVPSRWFEYMPLLGAFIIAGDRFKEKQPSFHLYNVTSGINTNDLSCWFTRWMRAQEFEIARSVVYWEVVDKRRHWRQHHITAGLLSFLFVGFLICMTVLSKDWYGFANAISMTVSIVVRGYLMQANRNGIDRAVVKAKARPGTYQSALQKWNEEQKRDTSQISERPNEDLDEKGQPWKSEYAKAMFVTPDSRAVTMFMPEQLVVPLFVRNPKPYNPYIYHIFRWIGWVAFGVHIVAIGNSKLIVQIYTIILLVIPTVLICWRVGCDDSRYYRLLKNQVATETSSTPYTCYIGSHLRATVFEWPHDVEFRQNSDHTWRRVNPGEIKSDADRSERRQDLYAWLNLDEAEEKSFAKWDLLPHRRNNDDSWTNDFNAKKKLIAENPTDIKLLKNKLMQQQKMQRVLTFLGNRGAHPSPDEEQVAPTHPGDPVQLAPGHRVNTDMKVDESGNVQVVTPVSGP